MFVCALQYVRHKKKRVISQCKRHISQMVHSVFVSCAIQYDADFVSRID